MLRMEVIDAFEMRKKIKPAMDIAVAGLAAGRAWFVSWRYGVIN